MEHKEIRARILLKLYEKYYSEQLGRPQMTTNVIQEAGLDSIDKNLVYGDIVYLKNGGLIDGKHAIGMAYPFAISITNSGIDKAEQYISNFIDYLEKNYNDEPDTKQISTLRNRSIAIMLKELIRVINQNSIFAEFLKTQNS
jgi:hypothetical protein